MKDIAVLITSHNRKNLTLNCLSKLYKQSGIDKLFTIDVFLVNDASSDGTVDAVKKHYKKVKIINGNGNLYWNRGMHLAWKTASKIKKYDFFMWLNDDVSLYEYSIVHLLDCSKISLYKSIICGVFETSYNSHEISYGGGNIINGVYHPNEIETDKLQLCTIINGNCVLIPFYVFKIVGYNDPIFPHSLGDHDYVLRAKKLHIKTFSSIKFIGKCKRDELLPNWCLPSVNLIDRIKSLYSPLGNSHPYFYSIYIIRHFGFFKFLKNLISIHIRLFFPILWK